MAKQATHLLGIPALGRAVVIEEELAFAFVVNDVRSGRHKCFEFLLIASDGKAAAIGAIDMNMPDVL